MFKWLLLPSDKRRLDFLLSRGHVSRPEKERILRTIMRMRSTPQRAALAAAACFLVVMSMQLGTRTSNSTALRARGVAASGLQIETGCSGPCRRGALLQIRVYNLTEAAYVSAYAMGPNGERIWYFPAIDAPMVHVAPSMEPRMLPTGIVLGDEHPPGAYTLYVVATDQPVDQADILRATPGVNGCLGQAVGHFQVDP